MCSYMSGMPDDSAAALHALDGTFCDQSIMARNRREQTLAKEFRFHSDILEYALKISIQFGLIFLLF